MLLVEKGIESAELLRYKITLQNQTITQYNTIAHIFFSVQVKSEKMTVFELASLPTNQPTFFCLDSVPFPSFQRSVFSDENLTELHLDPN